MAASEAANEIAAILQGEDLGLDTVTLVESMLPGNFSWEELKRALFYSAGLLNHINQDSDPELLEEAKEICLRIARSNFSSPPKNPDHA